MASNEDTLYDAATTLLAAAAQILAGTPAGAPTHRYVAHGPPAYDCPDSLIVHAGILQYGDFKRGGMDAFSSLRDPKMPVVPMVPLTITVLRCVNAQAMPAGGVAIRSPNLAKIAEDAEIVYRDGWSLFCGIHKLYRDGALFPGYPCRAFEIDGTIPVSPEGGALGWTMDVQVQLDGFTPPGA